MPDNDSVQMTRRWTWLQIALAVAHGLPAPQAVSFGPQPEYRWVYLHVDDDGEAALWADWLEDATPDTTGMFRWSAMKWGWHWSICVPTPTKPDPAEGELALAAGLADGDLSAIGA